MIRPALMVLNTRDAVSANKIEFNKKNTKCVVMGNGPSLKKDLQEIVERKEGSDHICVNAFPLAEQFFALKPEYIVLTDTAWWREDPNLNDAATREKVYETLEKVDWKMQLIITHNGDYNFMRSTVSNKNIDIIKLKTVNLYRPLDQQAFKCYDTGYFGPPFNNVLIIAIYSAIKAGYREIEIYGADLSYLFLIDVDQRTNEVFIEEEHFHKKGEKEILRKDAGIDSEPTTMHEFLYLQSMTLKSHELLNGYAKSKGIEITNKSSYSIIDAYSRA